MDFLARLFAPGRSRSKAKTGYVKRDGRYAIWIYVQCDRCGEKIPVRLRTVSYTHLDVYKRQAYGSIRCNGSNKGDDGCSAHTAIGAFIPG